MELRRYDAHPCEPFYSFAERLIKAISWLSSDEQIIGEFNGTDVIVNKNSTSETIYNDWLKNYELKHIN
jgi:hypothetical protein